MAMEGTGLTSTTAPGKTFDTRKDIADHYKSDWHRYNLKRREAGLPMLREEDFKARLLERLQAPIATEEPLGDVES